MTSSLMAGQAGAIEPAERFPLDNLLMRPNLYTYEGNWLFCAFPNCEVRAARLGFGQGRFRWEDYGLDPPSGAGIPLAYRLEFITLEGVEACLFSGQYPERPVASDPDRIAMSFQRRQRELFRIDGWPRMRWRFRSPDESMSADLAVSAQALVVWPDYVMPHNTFSMAIGACGIAGSVRIAGRELPVSGAGFFDHPRVLVEENSEAPLFGWYLYAPISFPSGWMLAAYHAEDGEGNCEKAYSAAFFTAAGGAAGWLPQSRFSGLRFDREGLPCAWDISLKGDGIEVRCRVRVQALETVRLWTSEPRPEPGRYLAYPLLMSVEGEHSKDGVVTRLEGGSGIAEFLVRKGYEPRYP